MINKTNPFEIFKRLFVSYYPVIMLFFLLSSYSAYFIFPDENVPLILLLFQASQLFCWVLIILALWNINPGNFFNRVIAIAGASLLAVLISYMGLALYLNFKPFHFFSSPLSAVIFAIMLLIALICTGTVIVAERSLFTEKQYTEEKTRRLLSDKKLIEDKLSLLQAQIEPQFLFNIMESICHLFDTDPEKANTMQMYFIQYLRATLVKTRSRITTIGQEIDLIQSYMNIFRVSMQDHLDYEIHVDPLVKELPFPSMLIQPVVETLIKHDLEKNPDGGRISISVKKRQDIFHIKIVDTVKQTKVESSIGDTLCNINERLKSLFDDKGIAKLEDNQPTGRVIVIEVPCV
ncbi:MAG: histidine kinase [Deltaproteobacteria bacterium]|nr:histidine kinase [Deltaproteobacteria bacterium]